MNTGDRVRLLGETQSCPKGSEGKVISVVIHQDPFRVACGVQMDNGVVLKNVNAVHLEKVLDPEA